MRSAWVLYRKEMLEMARSYKLIWIPVVFILLGIMQPLTTYYLPEILKASGDVPPGLLEGYEIPSAAAVMAQSLGQYGTIGMLVLALGAMNVLAGERYSGTMELILVRPVSPAAIVFAKWAAQLTLLIVALGLGAAGAAYYTEQLIGSLSWGDVIAASGVYGLWLLCAVSATLLFSGFLKSPVAAFLALALMAGLSLGQSLLPSWFEWAPAGLSGLSAGILMAGEGFRVGPYISAAILILICLVGAALLTRKNNLPA
ncbi:ABC transporter permease subunit [Paenibacillus odorifer]|uniref:ABC transporter permease subunit n=1 Tax=Paenibacillus odorifer TaxID=189426 RepID=UPI00289B542A|nr:ABC transporter permease subunit [Paenibacillus odorifer]